MTIEEKARLDAQAEISNKPIQKGKVENLVKQKNITTKKLIKASTLVMGLALIVFMTVSNVIFDPEKLDLFSWMTSSLILVGIMVFGLLMGESIGFDKQSEKIDGLYQKNLKEYNIFRASIEYIEIYFSQFYLWFKERELIRKKTEYLIDNSFDGQWAKIIVLHARKQDLQIGKLILDENEQAKIYVYENEKGEQIKIKKITKEQADIVKHIFEIKLESQPYSYYLSAFGDGKGGYELEQGSYLQSKLKSDKRFNRALKIGSSLLISLVWGMATTKDFVDGSQTQAWFNLLSRLTAFCTSFVSGWGSSVISVKTQAEIVENKTSVLKTFSKSIETKNFIPETYEQMVARELEEQSKKPIKQAVRQGQKKKVDK
jgi:hypothetical protein